MRCTEHRRRLAAEYLNQPVGLSSSESDVSLHVAELAGQRWGPVELSSIDPDMLVGVALAPRRTVPDTASLGADGLALATAAALDSDMLRVEARRNAMANGGRNVSDPTPTELAGRAG